MFTLAHLSDAHIGPLPRPTTKELLGKRFTGYVNWQRGRYRLHDMQVLQALVEDIKAQKPDHIAMTGDILNIGLTAEFDSAKRWLSTLGDPQDVSFVPGNHDAYTKAIMPLMAETFAPWTSDSPQPLAHYPYLRQRANVGLIGLSSGVPTAPLIASGTMGQRQAQEFVELLRRAKAQNLARIVMVHHCPIKTGGSFGRALTDAGLFEKIIAAEGADLILHGHNHRQSLNYIEGPDGTFVPVVGVASASAVPGTLRHRASYHLFHIEASSEGIKIEGHIRGASDESREVVKLGAIFPGKKRRFQSLRTKVR